MAGDSSDIDKILETVSNEEFCEDDWNLVCQSLQHLAAKWRMLARNIGLPGHVIAEIEENQRNAADCLDKSIQTWIGQNYNVDKYGYPSWRTLCRAVANIPDMKSFRDLAKKHGGQVPSGDGTSGGSGNTGRRGVVSEEDKLLSTKPLIGDLTLLKFVKNGEKQRLNVIKRASHKWKMIAPLLSKDANIIEKVAEKNRDNQDDCLRVVFVEHFLSNKPDKYTNDWNGLIELMEDVDEGDLAKEIREAVLIRR